MLGRGFHRRVVILGLAAALVAPLYVAAPASAAVFFSCTAGSGSASLTPGLGSTAVYQTNVSFSLSVSGCSNGETASVAAGSGFGFSTIKSGPGAPNKTLSCSTNYPDNTLVMAGFADPSFGITWGEGGSSTGIAKLKAGGALNAYKLVLVITDGKYAVLGQKAKLKGSFTGTPGSGGCTDANTAKSLSFLDSGDLIAQGAPTPNADYQFRDYDTPFRVRACALAPGSGLYALGNSGSWSPAIESVDGVNEHVLQFTAGAGLRLYPTTGEVGNDQYSVVMLFRLSDVSSYKRLIDVKDGIADSGLYLFNGALYFYPDSTTTSHTIANDEYAQVILTRTTGGIVRGYVDGAQQWQFTDTTGDAIITSSNELRFFFDNTSGGTTGENSAGAVARIRVYDKALSASEVGALGQTPGSPCVT